MSEISEVTSYWKLYQLHRRHPFFVGAEKLKCVMARRLTNQSVWPRGGNEKHFLNSYHCSRDVPACKKETNCEQDPLWYSSGNVKTSTLRACDYRSTERWNKGSPPGQSKRINAIPERYCAEPYYRCAPAILFHKRNGWHSHWRGLVSWLICGVWRSEIDMMLEFLTMDCFDEGLSWWMQSLYSQRQILLVCVERPKERTKNCSNACDFSSDKLQLISVWERNLLAVYTVVNCSHCIDHMEYKRSLEHDIRLLHEKR